MLRILNCLFILNLIFGPAALALEKDSSVNGSSDSASSSESKDKAAAKSEDLAKSETNTKSTIDDSADSSKSTQSKSDKSNSNISIDSAVSTKSQVTDAKNDKSGTDTSADGSFSTKSQEADASNTEKASSEKPTEKRVEGVSADKADAPVSPQSKSNVVGGVEDSKKSKRKKGSVIRGNAPCLAWIDRSMPIKGVILCVHGLGLHNGTYEALGKKLSASGYAVYSIDVRGFGSWMAAKGRELVDFDSCMADVKATLEVIHKAHRDLPVFLLGESMGGAIALKATSLYPELIDGLVSSVPAGDRFKQGRASLKVAIKLIKGKADKPFNVGADVVKQATEKPELRDAWLNDPLARLNLSPRELMQFQHFMNSNHESAKRITSTPVLIVQGCKDHLVRPEGTIELFNQLNTKDRKMVLLPKSEHLIFEEAQFNEDDLKTLNEWLETHVTGWTPRKKEDSLNSKLRFSKKASTLNNSTRQAPAEASDTKAKEIVDSTEGKSSTEQAKDKPDATSP